MNGVDENRSFEHSHSEHRHHIGTVIAATSNLDAKHTNLTLGGDYQYRLLTRWEIGGFGEMILAKHTENVFGVTL